MDFTSFMAAFALAAFWLNTLLIAGAGWSEGVALRRRYAFLASGTGARRGVVESGAGPGGEIAAWRVVQVGRSNGRGPILLHDRSRESLVFGGMVELATGPVEVASEAAAEVWCGAVARRRARTSWPRCSKYSRLLGSNSASPFTTDSTHFDQRGTSNQTWGS